MIKISRKDAKFQNLQWFYTGVPCKHEHDVERSVKTGMCRECVRLAHYTYYAKSREQALNGIKKWQQENKENVRRNSRKYRKNNPETEKLTREKYYTNNKDKKLSYNKRWRKQNISLNRSYNAKRRAQILQATPKWADLKKIEAVFERARQLEIETGIPHHVDHIIPLCGKKVCGFHVHYNLCPLPKVENLKKHNKLIDD